MLKAERSIDDLVAVALDTLEKQTLSMFKNELDTTTIQNDESLCIVLTVERLFYDNKKKEVVVGGFTSTFDWENGYCTTSIQNESRTDDLSVSGNPFLESRSIDAEQNDHCIK